VHGVALAVWTGAIGLLGLLFGLIAPGADDLLDSGAARELVDRLGGGLLAVVLSLVAIVVSCFSIGVISRAGSDETAGRAEAVLATATSRTRWFVGSVLVALLGSTWMLVVAGIALWVGVAAAGDGSPGDLLTAAVGWAPAVWVVVGLAAVLLAVRGSWAVLAWGWPLLFLTLTTVGEALDLPAWLTGASPYSHVPSMPGEPWRWTPELVLTALAAAMLVGAWSRFRARDIG
jgi:ABC-2 type transport system permease protein